MPEDVNGDGLILRFSADEFRDLHKQCIDAGRWKYADGSSPKNPKAMLFQIGEDFYEVDGETVKKALQGCSDDVILRRPW